MRPYTFDFINHDGSIDSFDIGAFIDDADAVQRAQAELFVSQVAIRVDVWSHGACVARLPREEARASPALRPLAAAVHAAR